MENIDNQKILHLTLKKVWFDKILSGEKTEEYRDIKEFWKTRLVAYASNHSHLYNQPHLKDRYNIEFKKFDIVIFKNGYAKNAPTIVADCKDILVDTGHESWGAEPNKHYFVIKLENIKLIENATN